jgi:hypothetical protein
MRQGGKPPCAFAHAATLSRRGRLLADQGAALTFMANGAIVVDSTGRV